jgi:hypothetical protein
MHFVVFHLPYTFIGHLPSACFPNFSLIVVLMSRKLRRALQKCCRYLGSSFLGVIPAITGKRNRIIEQHYLGLGQTSR